VKDFYEFEDLYFVNLHERCPFDMANAFMMKVCHGDGELIESGKVYFKDEEHLISFMGAICKTK
jgi:hypothetical protein